MAIYVFFLLFFLFNSLFFFESHLFGYSPICWLAVLLLRYLISTILCKFCISASHMQGSSKDFFFHSLACLLTRMFLLLNRSGHSFALILTEKPRNGTLLCRLLISWQQNHLAHSASNSWTRVCILSTAPVPH